MLVYQNAVCYWSVKLPFARSLPQALLDLLIDVDESQGRVAENAGEYREFFLICNLVAFQGQRAQVYKILEQRDIDSENVAIVQIQSHNFAVFGDSRGS